MTSTQARAQRSRKRWMRWGAVLLLVLVIPAAVIGTWEQLPHSAPRVRVMPRPSPAFRPVTGDVGDGDDGLNVALGPVPGFQFKNGGYTLKGVTVDARTRRAVGGVSIWITLPPVLGQRTAPQLRSVSTVSGVFSFSHLAAGRYNLAAARYFVQAGQPIYPEATLTNVVIPQHTSVRLSLSPQSAPGTRQRAGRAAQNVVILDLSGVYAESWFDDPALQAESHNVRSLATSGARAAHVVAPYGWHPADQYALLSGTYPSWRGYDAWPQLTPWGTPDGIDTPFWYNPSPTTLESGQESLFDVARGYGMSTAVLGGQKYLLSDVSTRGVQTAQVGLVFDSASWLAAAQHLVTTMISNSNGFVFYGELDPPFGAASAAGAVPDAPGGSYARAMQTDDELVGALRSWLAKQKLLDNTVVIVTASEAQVNETTSDNYYGMGPGGRGSSLDVPLVISGKGVMVGAVEDRTVSSFAVAATALRALCLPPPANARASAVTSLFQMHCP